MNKNGTIDYLIKNFHMSVLFYVLIFVIPDIILSSINTTHQVISGRGFAMMFVISSTCSYGSQVTSLKQMISGLNTMSRWA